MKRYKTLLMVLAAIILFCGITIGKGTGTIIGLMYSPAIMLKGFSSIWGGASFLSQTALLGELCGALGAVLWSAAMFFRYAKKKALWRDLVWGAWWGGLSSAASSALFALSLHFLSEGTSFVNVLFFEFAYGILFWMLLGLGGGAILAIIRSKTSS